MPADVIMKVSYDEGHVLRVVYEERENEILITGNGFTMTGQFDMAGV
ncbi:hypothetical protein [Desulfofundulus sp.]